MSGQLNLPPIRQLFPEHLSHVPPSMLPLPHTVIHSRRADHVNNDARSSGNAGSNSAGAVKGLTSATVDDVTSLTHIRPHDLCVRYTSCGRFSVPEHPARTGSPATIAAPPKLDSARTACVRLPDVREACLATSSFERPTSRTMSANSGSVSPVEVRHMKPEPSPSPRFSKPQPNEPTKFLSRTTSRFRSGRRSDASSQGPGPTSSSFISFAVSPDPTFARPVGTGTSDGAHKSSTTGPGDRANADMTTSTSGRSGRKHVCDTCGKLFKRPSSLKTHKNKHTGETPFMCPYPNCGSRFSVNSNMRRHYKSHKSPRAPTSQRQSENSIDFVRLPSRQGLHPYAENRPLYPYHSPNPIYADDGNRLVHEDDYTSFVGRHSKHRRRSSLYPNLHHEMRSPTNGQIISRSPSPLASSISSSSTPPSPYQRTAETKGIPYSRSTLDAREHAYNASSPYIRSFAGLQVSTALRPAFRDGSH